jgi:hypothetical protein
MSLIKLLLLLLKTTACNSLSNTDDMIFSKSSRAPKPQSLPLPLTLMPLTNSRITLQAWSHTEHAKVTC